jgi:uncharacterized membrane protein (DUF2068 family)
LATDRSSWLFWIVAFKALKAVTLTALGIALIATRHSDPVDLFVRFAVAVHLPVTSRLLQRAIAFLSDLTIARPTALAITAFAYASLMGAEGLAIYSRKPWARWFTIVATSSLVPVEIYEIAQRPHPTRVAVLAANVAVVWYLWDRTELFVKV